MKRFLKSTTAMLLTISLALPGPALTQEIPFDFSDMTQEEIASELVSLGFTQDEIVARLLAYGLVTGDNPTQTANDLAAEAIAAAEAAKAEAATAEAEPEPEVAAQPAEEAAEAPVDTQPAPEATPAAEPAPETADAPAAPDVTEAEATSTPEPETPEATDSAASPAPEPVETADVPEVVVPEADPEPVDSATQAEAEAEVAAESQGSLAASGEGAAEAEVVEETVTEDTARSSSEEFQTDVKGQARASDSDDDGLSTGQKAALLGLGVLALSQILKPNEQVVANTGDRVVVERDGQYRIIKNDDALLRRPGSDVTTYRYEDGSTRTVVTREDGSQVETVRAADGRVLRRTRILENGTEVVLFDDTEQVEQVQVSELPQTTDRRQVDFRTVDAEDLAAALDAAQASEVDRRFSLSQIRNIDAVRRLVPEINVDTINFATNSAVIQPEEAQELAMLGRAISLMIENNPREVFLVEGHTDAVGAAQYNLALSDRRAESVALALTEYFGVPPENLVVQGYGETDLVIPTAEAERANRRAAVRRITPLLQPR